MSLPSMNPNWPNYQQTNPFLIDRYATAYDRGFSGNSYPCLLFSVDLFASEHWHQSFRVVLGWTN